MFEARETGSGEALKKSGSNLITFKKKHKAGYSMCNVFHWRQTKQTNLGFTFKFRTLLLVGNPLSQV